MTITKCAVALIMAAAMAAVVGVIPAQEAEVGPPTTEQQSKEESHEATLFALRIKAAGMKAFWAAQEEAMATCKDVDHSSYVAHINGVRVEIDCDILRTWLEQHSQEGEKQ